LAKILELSQEKIVELVHDGEVSIAVVGLGYVGLPLATLFALEGARVYGCDVDKELVKMVNAGRSRIIEHDISWLLNEGAKTLTSTCPNCGIQLFKYRNETFCPSCGKIAAVDEYGARLGVEISETHKSLMSKKVSLQSLLEKTVSTGNLTATTDTSSAVSKSDVVLIAVGTPLKDKYLPDKSAIITASQTIAQGLEVGDLVIVKSTVPPGTTEREIEPILENGSGLECGKDFGLAHMPERIKEGFALYEFKTIPRIVGGVDQRSTQAAAALFSVFPAPIYQVGSPSITETAKLFENIYRDTNIALVNELAIICELMGVDVMEAVRAANNDPKTHLLTPGLVGGYCLPKDPYFLVNEALKNSYTPKLITAAREVNENMPSHTVDMVIEVFREIGIAIEETKIALLGLSFKGDSGDLRNSPAITIAKKLVDLGANIWAHDPLARFEELEQVLPEISISRDLKKTISKSRCVVIATGHSEYRTLKPDTLAGSMSLPGSIVDCRHIFNPRDFTDPRLLYRGLGHPLHPKSNS
jgi:UDP-N-acetyl-D-mannosaminuronic acid dehydrogenase